MTATLTESQPTIATPAVPPVEFVMALPEEQKRAVLAALLNEVYATEGDFAAIALRHGDVDLGYLARTQDMLTEHQKLMLTLSREDAEHFSLPIPDDLDLDDCVSPERLEAIHRELEAQFAARSRVAS